MEGWMNGMCDGCFNQGDKLVHITVGRCRWSISEF